MLSSTVSMHAVVKYTLKLVTMQSETRSRVSKLYFTLLRCAFSFLLQSKKERKRDELVACLMLLLRLALKASFITPACCTEPAVARRKVNIRLQLLMSQD